MNVGSGSGYASSRGLILVLPAIAFMACAERTLIRTAPPDAKVLVDGQLVGVSPLRYSVRSSEIREHIPLRIEREGFESIDGSLATQRRPGRIVGAVFLLGIPMLFRGSLTFQPVQDFKLKPDEQLKPQVERSPTPGAPPLVTPPAGPTTGAGPVAEKLRRLQELYDRGLITDHEYRTTRARILSNL